MNQKNLTRFPCYNPDSRTKYRPNPWRHAKKLNAVHKNFFVDRENVLKIVIKKTASPKIHDIRHIDKIRFVLTAI